MLTGYMIYENIRRLKEQEEELTEAIKEVQEKIGTDSVVYEILVESKKRVSKLHKDALAEQFEEHQKS